MLNVQSYFVAWQWFSHLLIFFVLLWPLSQVYKAPIICNSMPQMQILYFNIFRRWKRQDTRKQNKLAYLCTSAWGKKKKEEQHFEMSGFSKRVLSPTKYTSCNFECVVVLFYFFKNLWRWGFPEILIYYINLINKMHKYTNTF